MGTETMRQKETTRFSASPPLEIFMGRRGGGVIKKCGGGGVGMLQSDTN